MSNTARIRAQYKDFWTSGVTERHSYYDRLYAPMRHRFSIPDGARVLDVAGGVGELMRYFGVSQADILDISESGLAGAKKNGFNPIEGDVQGPFPIANESYDVAFLFEVLEHLTQPSITISETRHALKSGGTLYVGQPNMRADGVHHVRRYYPKELLSDLDKAGFDIKWVDYVPAYSMRDAILDDIRSNPSIVRKAVQCANLLLSLLPHGVRYQMAQCWPKRFALMAVVCAVKR